MPDSQIATIVVPALVIQLNNQQFITDNTITGQVLNVPCRDVFIDEVLYWGVPVKGDGMFTTIQWILATGSDSTKPTFDSFLVQRIRDKDSNYTWWVYVENKNNFKNSCATCCGDAAVPMPGVNGSFIPTIAPCQVACVVNDDGDYETVYGLPSLSGTETYYPIGSYNNEELFEDANANGYANISLLLSYLDSKTSNIGSPAVTITWSASSDLLTLVATGMNELDSLCILIEPILPSP